MGARRHTSLLAIAFGDDGSLPVEFRLFVKGWNATENGRFLFDEVAARLVMSAHEKWGVDLAIDLEHQMLDSAATDPTARDARGWFKLALRPDGSLWATQVTWTPDGAARLSEKRQRYVSPAFEVDPDTKRVVKVLNCAICSIPATHNTPALVAASVALLGATAMNPEQVKKALDALTAGDAEGALSILKDMIATAASGEAPAEEPAEELAAEEPAADPEEDEEQAAVMAATARLTRLTGKTTIGSAVEEVELWRASHLKLEVETQKLAKERAALELGKRKENAVMLTKLGAETPHTTGLSKGKLCKRLLDEPIDEQTERVAALLAARGGKLPTEMQPPTGSGAVEADGSKLFTLADGRVVKLSARELAMCGEMKIDPTDYAGRKPKKKD